MLTIGQRIKTLRVLYWLSQQEFADRVGVSRRQVAYWENDQDAPSTERLPRICQVLRVDANWLLTGKRLMDVYNPGQASRNAQAHLSRTEHLKARLFRQLPLAEDFSTSAQPEWIDALPEDEGALVFNVQNDSFAPMYRAGDLLYFRPLDISFPAPASKIATLHEQQVAVSLNGKSNLKRLMVEARSEKECAAYLNSIAGKASRRLIRNEDNCRIHGVAYKCVRPL